MKQIRLSISFILVTFLFSTNSFASEVDFDVEQVSIETINGIITFDMEMALNQEQRRQGLMFRTELGSHRGMLFDYGYPFMASMWMKNTLLPLDMLFIRADGKISQIHRRAIPGDLTPINSKEPIRSVIEIKGGQSISLGISIGDTILHPIFRTAP